MTSCLDSVAINCIHEVCSLYKPWKPLSCYPGIPERKKVALNNPHHQVQMFLRTCVPPRQEELGDSAVRKDSFKNYWYRWGGYQKGV